MKFTTAAKIFEHSTWLFVGSDTVGHALYFSHWLVFVRLLRRLFAVSGLLFLVDLTEEHLLVGLLQDLNLGDLLVGNSNLVSRLIGCESIAFRRPGAPFG